MPVNDSDTYNKWSYPSLGSITIASNTSPNLGDFVWNSDSSWKINVNTNLDPDLKVDGDIKLKGRSLTEMLDKIEERLAILRPNPELEGRWEELKLLGEKYRELEKELLEKEEMWKILNK